MTVELATGTHKLSPLSGPAYSLRNRLCFRRAYLGLNCYLQGRHSLVTVPTHCPWPFWKKSKQVETSLLPSGVLPPSARGGSGWVSASQQVGPGPCPVHAVQSCAPPSPHQVAADRATGPALFRPWVGVGGLLQEEV